MKYLIIAFTAAGFLMACNPKTTEIMDVEETAEETNSTTDDGMPKADIAEGKVIFLTDCVTCHSYTTGPNSVADLDNFTKARIDAALPKMLKNAELNEEKSRQVKAYLYWELEN